MKKFLIFLLIAAIGIGLWIFIAHKNEEAFLQKLYEEATNVCMRASENMMEDKTIQVHSVDFNLKELRPVVEGMRYVAYVDWYVEAEVYAGKKTDMEYWMTMVSGSLPATVNVDGKSITLTYMDDNFNEGCNLIYNGYGSMNGYDYYKDVTGHDENAYTGYGEVSCPVCGERFRSNSSYGLRAKKGGPCGFRGCGK